MHLRIHAHARKRSYSHTHKSYKTTYFYLITIDKYTQKDTYFKQLVIIRILMVGGHQ